MDVDEYEALIKPDLYELSMDDVNEAMLIEAENVKTMPKVELVDL